MKSLHQNFFHEDKGCPECGGCHDTSCHGDEMLSDEDAIIELVDPESGETFEFYYADNFDFNGESFCVLVTMDEDEPEYLIARLVDDPSGDVMVETLTEEDDIDAIYDAYDALLEELFDEEGEEEDEAETPEA